MASEDLHSIINNKVALNYGAISTNTTTVGSIIDTKNFESLEFIIYSGTITDGTFTPKLEAGDEADGSDFAEVDEAFILGTIANATFTGANDNATKRIGFVGHDRYVRLSLVSTSVTSGGSLGAVALLGHARNAPTAGA